MGRPPVLISWGGEIRRRRDVIEELHRAGVPKAEIARRLGVIYQIVQMVIGPTGPQAGSRTDQALKERRATKTPEVPAPLARVDAVLLGCVATKDVVARPAKDLYQSPMFRGRRRHAEASGRPWFVVSAEYGLVGPDEVIEPYDTRIASRPLAERRVLAQQVAERLETELGGLRGRVLELHAGDEYAQAIGPMLRSRGATIVRPLLGVPFGEQLAWYRSRYGHLGGARPASPKPARAFMAVPSFVDVQIGDGRGLGRRITEAFVSGSLDLSTRHGAPTVGWAGMPEVVAADALRAIGASELTLRLFLTFCAAMDRARDADRLARAAIRMHAVHSWAFDPQEVAHRPLRELATALRQFGVSQRHSMDAYAWRRIAVSITNQGGPAVIRAIYQGEGDAGALLKELPRIGADGRTLFPLLRGPKIAALWVRLMAHPGGAKIRRLELLPVAVDVQVRKVTEYLGVTETLGADLDRVRLVIQDTWHADVERHGSVGPVDLANTCGALDPALWFYGKWGCTPCERAGRQLPISEICADCRFGRT